MSSPPPPNPNTTADATATADFLKSVAPQRPRKHSHPPIYQTFYNPKPATTAAFPPPTQRQQQPRHSNSRIHNQQSAISSARRLSSKHKKSNSDQNAAGGVIYPYPSHALAFLARLQQSSSNQKAAVGVKPNPPRHDSDYPHAVRRPYGSSNSNIPGQTSHQLVAPSSEPTLKSGGGVMPTFGTGVSVPANPKIVGQSPVADDNGLKHTRDNNGDDTFVIIRDRKVQVSEGTSLYAQCRSWLKNGFTLENQPIYADCVKSLPKPLPASVLESRKEDDMETEEETEDVENLSAKELLQQHVKHAKKLRARSRNQRLQRIERYKDRLALLLPSVVDQQTKNEPAS